MSQKNVKKPKVFICDIEGTTTSVKYWGQKLVPYIKFSTDKCLKSRWDAPLLMNLIDNLRNSTNEANREGADSMSSVLKILINFIINFLILIHSSKDCGQRSE